jgi:hypothetical protein
MLDHVERRRFLVEPAGEHPAPALVGAFDVDLDERSGELLLLPGGGGFARSKAYDHVLPPRRLTRVQRDVLDDAVALVEDSEDRDPLQHRRHATLPGCRRRRLIRHAGRLVLLLSTAPASGEAKRKQ